MSAAAAMVNWLPTLNATVPELPAVVLIELVGVDSIAVTDRSPVEIAEPNVSAVFK